MKPYLRKTFIWLLLSILTVTANTMFAQISNRPFVKKFEAGIPNFSSLNSIWKTGNGWWGHFTKIDSTPSGNFYYGAEIVLTDSSFDIQNRISFGDTSYYYYDYPLFQRKSAPDGNGNFWYWITSKPDSALTRPLLYGKFDQSGNKIFENTLPNTSIYDYFFEFLPLRNGNGLLVSKHHSTLNPLTWLTWIDSLGNITYIDSTIGTNSISRHRTSWLTTIDSDNTVIAPSMDYDFGITNTYNIRPKLIRFQIYGPLIEVIDLNYAFHDHFLGNFSQLSDKGYVCWIQEYVQYPNLAYEKHRPGIAKLDSNFNFEWKKYLFPAKIENEISLFHQSIKGDFFLLGRHDRFPTDSNQLREWFITKFSTDLDSLWTRFYNLGGDSINNILQTPTQIQEFQDGSLLILVDNSGNGINYTTLYRLDSNGCLISGCNIGDTIPTPPIPPTDKPLIDQQVPLLNGQILAYPNPSTGQFNLEWDVWPGDRSDLKIFDLTGMTLLEKPIQREARPSVLDLSNWANGFYFLEIKSNAGRVFRTKVLLQK